MRFHCAVYPDGRSGYPQVSVEEARKELEDKGYDTTNLVETRGIWFDEDQNIGIALIHI